MLLTKKNELSEKKRDVFSNLTNLQMSHGKPSHASPHPSPQKVLMSAYGLKMGSA